MIRNPSGRGNFAPEDHGMVGWSYDPIAAASGAIIPANGTLQVAKVRLAVPSLVTAIMMVTTVAGSGLTSGQNFAVLFDSNRAQVGVTADQSTAWAAAAGMKDMALVTPVALFDSFCYVGFYGNGTTLPTWRAASAGSVLSNANLSGSSSRFASANTGLTTTPPASISAGGMSIGTPWWVGLR